MTDDTKAAQWLPIAAYDAMKRKPLRAVFFFEPLLAGREVLPPTIETTRSYGRRVCTHFLPLPADPA